MANTGQGCGSAFAGYKFQYSHNENVHIVLDNSSGAQTHEQNASRCSPRTWTAADVHITQTYSGFQALPSEAKQSARHSI